MNQIFNKMSQGYRVKNKYLKAIMGTISRFDAPECDNFLFRGLTGGKGVGSVILTYLVRRAFNIHRFPCFEDRHYSNCIKDMDGDSISIIV